MTLKVEPRLIGPDELNAIRHNLESKIRLSYQYNLPFRLLAHILALEKRMSELEAACIAARHQLLGASGLVADKTHREHIGHVVSMCDMALTK